MIETIVNDRLAVIPWLRIESRISPYLRFGRQDNLEVRGEMYHRSLFTVMPYQKIVRHHRVTFLRRGIYNVGTAALTAGDILPATTLASYCYANMFLNCTGLTTAPTTLPATTLVANCYRSMFDGCTELTTAPVLPAATLQYYCYAWMFDGCTKLNNVTCLATNISADDCTYRWLNGVAATGTFTRAESMEDWTTGVSGIPSGWTWITGTVL